MFYKNCSCIAKTFYGVTFEPNSIKEVHGIINDKMMVLMSNPVKKVTKITQQKPSSEKPKEESTTPAVQSTSSPAQSSNAKEEIAVVKDDDKSGKNKKS